MRYAALCNRKLQFLLRRIELLTMQSCRGRLIAHLLEQQDEKGVVRLAGSREDLARRLGVSRAADPQLLEMARVFRVPALRGIRYVYLPQVLPYFRSACGSALGLCWKSGIAAEVIGMPDGSIGEQLQQAKIYLNTPDLFAWTLVIVLVSLVFEKVFLILLKWGERTLERM